jgi:hypothetical protein
MLQRWFLCTRCADRDKNRLPATGHIHPRLRPYSPSLHGFVYSWCKWGSANAKALAILSIQQPF